MHLKNFSLIEGDEDITLAPAYDLINTRLVINEKEDPDESALSINGKRRKLKLDDFYQLGISLTLSEKQIENTCKRFFSAEKVLIEEINNSFLSNGLKDKYAEILKSCFKELNQ